MRAVLLAAGLGNRLQHHTETKPKPLVTVAGRPLVAYTLDALAGAGVSEVVVVTGHRAAMLRQTLDELSPLPIIYRHNDRFREGASLSLAAARDACGDDPFLLVMSDHLFDADLLTRLAAHDPGDGVAVGADAAPREPEYVDEATRLLVRNGRVRAIGKELPDWNALDTGAFHCGPAVWDTLRSAPPEGCTLSDVFTVLAAAGRLRAADVSGAFWYDVDTPEDRAAAEALLLGDQSAAPANA